MLPPAPLDPPSSPDAATASVFPSPLSAMPDPKLSYASEFGAFRYARGVHVVPLRVNTGAAPDSSAKKSCWLAFTPRPPPSCSIEVATSTLPLVLMARRMPNRSFSCGFDDLMYACCDHVPLL